MAQKRRRWGHIQTIVPGEQYRIFWPAGYGDDGKRIPGNKMVYGTWEDADLELAAVRISFTGVDTSTTWDEFWAGKVAPTLPDLAKNTQRDYVRIYTKVLSPLIGGAKVCMTDYRFACDVLGRIEAPSTQRYAHRLWKKMCNMARHEHLLVDNPIDRTIKLKPRNRRKKHELMAEDAMGLLRKLAGTRYLAFCIMALIGGMRKEECIPICSWHVRRLGEHARVDVESALTSAGGAKDYKSTKTVGSERYVLFAEPFASILLALASRADGPLFPGPNPEGDEPNETWFAHPDRMSDNWEGWCRRHKVDFIRMGDMRTIWSDWHAEAQTPDSLVSIAMGHTDGSTRGVNYQRRTRKGMEVVADSLADYLMSTCPCYELLQDS